MNKLKMKVWKKKTANKQKENAPRCFCINWDIELNVNSPRSLANWQRA